MDKFIADELQSISAASTQEAALIKTVATEADANTAALAALMVPAHITASLGANVLLNNTALYFDGPSVAQGSSGTWFASGTVTFGDSAAATTYLVKLWDGTTLISSTGVNIAAAGASAAVSLSGFLTSPAGNIRISVRGLSSATGSIYYNASGLGKDSTLSAFRIA